VWKKGDVLSKRFTEVYNPIHQDRFNQAMTGASNMWNVGEALSKVFDFGKVKKVVDVGGSQGTLVVQLLRANPHLSGTVFDLKHVVDDAKQNVYSSYSDVHSRLSFVDGSFFESVPADGDIYTAKAILHDWDDVKAVDILKTIAKSMKEHSKVLIIDRVIQEVGDSLGGLMDLHMMVLADAKERTEKEFEHIFALAGLRVNRIIPIPPFFSVVEGERIRPS